MNDFWTRKLGGPATVQTQPRNTGKVWWQEPDPLSQVQPDRYSQPAPQGMPLSEPVMSPQQEDQLFRQLQRVTSDQLSQEQMEFMAEHELKRPKYNQVCPQCSSGNFIPAGTRAGSVTMPTDKCFDCNYSARGPEPALAGRGSGGGKAARQTDTGGGSGPSLYLAFDRMPAAYVPRA